MLKLLETIPASGGTYILMLQAREQEEELAVGKLGHLQLQAGYYLYVGSAFGRGGLRSRLKHHLNTPKRCHWHLDYVRSKTQPIEIWCNSSTHHYEHQWAAALQKLPAATIPLPRFGASDCQCASHFFYFVQKPSIDTFRQHTECSDLECLFVE